VNVDYERLLSRQPLVVQKRVRWSDCDPAGVVYTGKFTEYLLAMMNHVFDTLAGDQRYFDWLMELGVDTPCKGLEMEFHGALWPDDVFEMHATVQAIRHSSFDVRVEARQADGRRIFSGRFSPICISREVRQRVAIPPRMLDALRRLHPSASTPEGLSP
jgi:acyl-CoA thioesterase FadM